MNYFSRVYSNRQQSSPFMKSSRNFFYIPEEMIPGAKASGIILSGFRPK